MLTLIQHTYSEFPPELYSNTPYLWTLLVDADPEQCEDCLATATWQCQSDEEMPYVGHFCGTCASTALQAAPKVEIEV